MKKSILLGASLAVAGLALVPANAQTHSSTSTSTSSGDKYVQSSKIIGSRIRSADGSEVGTIKDVVLDRETGCMAYTVLETSGSGNGSTAGNSGSSSGSRTTTTTTTRRTVAVPYTAFQPTSDPTVYTTQIQRERIYSAPAYDYNRI
ncbi:MAG: PRC-barrel domain-containing protein, partial [Verrucomicrobiota bacterium]|nr:PRC-barrel domain-containing protein [Verrucomicrobiota bacterium]